MLSFKEFIFESRKYGHLPQQAKLNALDRLSKYKNDDKVHITYTLLNKVGINPKTKFTDTAAAVFCYPLKEIWSDIERDGIRNVEFAANKARYIFVLKEKTKPLQETSTYNFEKLNKDLKKIREIVNDDAALEVAEKQVSANISKTDRPAKFLMRFLYHLGKNLKSKSPAKSFGPPQIAGFISKIQLSLGYSGFKDTKGKGDIHPAEPIQSYFLSSKYYEVIDSVEIKELDIKDTKTRDYAALLKSNHSTMTDVEIKEILKSDPSLIRYIGKPNTEILKFVVGITKPERWGSRQTKPDNKDDIYDTSTDYSPAENMISGLEVLRYYKKLPEDFIQWMMTSHPNQMVTWLLRTRQKMSIQFLNRNLKIDSRIIDLYPNITSNIASEIWKNSDKNMSVLYELSDKMPIDEFINFGMGINIEKLTMGSSFNYPVTKLYHEKLKKKKNPNMDDIYTVAQMAQKGATIGKQPMEIIDDLKNRFPHVDFTEVGRWPFWRR